MIVIKTHLIGIGTLHNRILFQLVIHQYSTTIKTKIHPMRCFPYTKNGSFIASVSHLKPSRKSSIADIAPAGIPLFGVSIRTFIKCEFFSLK